MLIIQKQQEAMKNSEDSLTSVSGCQQAAAATADDDDGENHCEEKVERLTCCGGGCSPPPGWQERGWAWRGRIFKSWFQLHHRGVSDAFVFVSHVILRSFMNFFVC